MQMPIPLMSHEKFVKRTKRDYPTIKVLGKYTGAMNKIKVKCIDCGNIWNSIPGRLQSMRGGCPECKGKKFRLKPKDVSKIIKDKYPNVLILKPYETAKNKNEIQMQKYLSRF